MARAAAFALLALAFIASTAFVGATSGGDHGEVLTCNTVKCKEGHICKIKHGHPKCIHACAVHRCKRGHYCTLKDGQPECVSKCARKKCAEGKTCKLKRGKPRCVRQKPEDTVNPCAFTLCAIGNQCVVENGKAECISVCASVRCKDGLECQPDEKGNPQCVAAGAPNPCAFTTCLVGNFCQVEDGKALCVTNCATVKCAAGTRCETDPQNGNPVCVPDN